MGNGNVQYEVHDHAKPIHMSYGWWCLGSRDAQSEVIVAMRMAAAVVGRRMREVVWAVNINNSLNRQWGSCPSIEDTPGIDAC